MLKCFLPICGESLPRASRLTQRLRACQVSKAGISTNSAINRSLRRSQSKESIIRRRSPPSRERLGPSPRSTSHERERTRRFDRHPGGGIEDTGQSRAVNERYKVQRKDRLGARSSQRRIATTLDAKLRDGHSHLAGKVDKVRTQYDYSPNPGGNRATRRATKYGRVSEQDSKQRSSVGGDINVRVGRLRGDMKFKSSGAANGGSQTVPDAEVTADAYKSSNPSPGRPSFTMGRQAPIAEGISNSSVSSSHRSRESRSLDQSFPNYELHAPLSMPYTTSASEFLYGTSVVTAALHSSRRKLYKLYIYDGENREVQNQDVGMRRIALKRGIKVENVKGEWLRVMDKMSNGRPHNVRINLPLRPELSSSLIQ